MSQADRTATEHGRYLEERRLDLGLKWSEVARDMERLHGVSVTSDYLSKIKRGVAPLSKMSVDAREALRQVLRITPDDWEAETGLYSPANETVVARVADGVKQQFQRAFPAPRRPTSAAAQGYRVPRPAPRPIDPALLEAAELFGGQPEFAGLREYRWQRTLNDIPFKQRPTTAAGWLAVYVEHKDDWEPEEPDE